MKNEQYVHYHNSIGISNKLYRICDRSLFLSLFFSPFFQTNLNTLNPHIYQLHILTKRKSFIITWWKTNKKIFSNKKKYHPEQKNITNHQHYIYRALNRNTTDINFSTITRLIELQTNTHTHLIYSIDWLIRSDHPHDYHQRGRCSKFLYFFFATLCVYKILCEKLKKSSLCLCVVLFEFVLWTKKKSSSDQFLIDFSNLKCVQTKMNEWIHSDYFFENWKLKIIFHRMMMKDMRKKNNICNL